MISPQDLENAVRSAIPVSHLEIIDQSNGCGENYAILVVSEVGIVGREELRTSVIDPSTRRPSRVRPHWRDIVSVSHLPR